MVQKLKKMRKPINITFSKNVKKKQTSRRKEEKIINYPRTGSTIRNKRVEQGDQPVHIQPEKNRKVDQDQKTFTVKFKANNEDPWGLLVYFDVDWSRWHVTEVHKGMQASCLGVVV